jgi:uncharacterized membrane protein YcaP (DUF421 family)
MDAVFRGAAMYFFLLLIFRLSGKRTMAQATTFDLILLLIISEATQQAMLGEDFSVTNGFLLILTLVTLDIGLSLWKRRSPRADKIMDGLPLVLVKDGQPLEERMSKSRVDEQEILQAARELQGIERMEQIKYAVLEQGGAISIVPRE